MEVSFSLLLIIVASAEATEITWHRNNDNHDNSDPAKSAPKSQKYWDEHNIQLPEYAKTDEEVWAEGNRRRGGGSILLS
jgi:hypothetical protein